MPRKKTEGEHPAAETNGAAGHDHDHEDARPAARRTRPRRRSRAEHDETETETEAGTPADDPGAEEMAPARPGMVGRMLYGAAYGVSYGVSLPVLIVVRAMPRDNVVMHGLADGSRAARATVAGLWGDPEPSLEGPAPATAAAALPA